MPQLDPKLKDLLVREAHLRMSRAQLMPVWSQTEAELRAIQVAKPAFWTIFSRHKRADYEARLAEVLKPSKVVVQAVGRETIRYCPFCGARLGA